jgi:hypothetical protein
MENLLSSAKMWVLDFVYWTFPWVWVVEMLAQWFF